MKQLMLGTFIFMMATSAFAETYSCRVKGYSDYTVEVNDRGNAAFFDNDSWFTLKFIGGGNGVEDISGADFEYFFKGLDADGKSAISLRFVTYKSTSRNPNGFLSFKESGKLINTKVFCKAVSSNELMSGI